MTSLKRHGHETVFEDDERDLLELIHLAAYLEDQAERGLFPKARFKRYSDTLDRLIRYLA